MNYFFIFFYSIYLPKVFICYSLCPVFYNQQKNRKITKWISEHQVKSIDTGFVFTRYRVDNKTSSSAQPCNKVELSRGDAPAKQSSACVAVSGLARRSLSGSFAKRSLSRLRAVNYLGLLFSRPRRLRRRRAAQPRRQTINRERGGLKNNKNSGSSKHNNNKNNQRAIERQCSGVDETPSHVRTTQQQKEQRVRHRRLPEMNDSGGVWERRRDRRAGEEKGKNRRKKKAALVRLYFSPPWNEEREESQQGRRVGEGIECNQKTTAGVEEIAGYCNWEIIRHLLLLRHLLLSYPKWWFKVRTKVAW